MASVIAATIQLRDQFSAVLKNVNKNLSDFQKQATYASNNIAKTGKDIGKVGMGLTKMFTVPILAAGAGIYKLGVDFEDANNTIRTTTGATGKSLEGLNSTFKATYSNVTQSMSDTAQAVADLNVRTGLSGKSLQTLSTQFLNLAKITGESASTLIPAETKAFADAGLKQSQYSAALDYTYKVHEKTGVSIDTLTAQMTKFGAPLRQMGFDFNTSAALIGQFNKDGVNTQIVVGSMRTALSKMAKEGVTNASQAFVDIIKRIKDAGSASKANAIALQYFGAKAGPDLTDAIRSGKMSLTDLLATLAKSPDTINSATKATLTFTDNLKLLWHQLSIKLEPMSKPIIADLNKMLPAITSVIGWVGKMVDKFAAMTPAQQMFAIKCLAMAAAIGPVLVGFSKVIKTVTDTSGGINQLGKDISNAGGIMKWLVTPGGMVVAVLGALIIIAAAVVLNWGCLTKAYKDNETAIKIIAGVLSVTLLPLLTALSIRAGLVALATLGVTWPIYAVIAACALLGAGIYELIKHWNDLMVTLGFATKKTGDDITALNTTTHAQMNSMNKNINAACGNSVISLNTLGAKCPPTATNFTTLNTQSSSSVKTMQQNIDVACGKSKKSLIDLGNIGKPTSKALNDGLVNGMNNQDSVTKAASGLVAKIKAQFTSKTGFDIHSPSKWATTMAGQIGTGFVNGLSAKNILAFMSNLVGKIKSGASGVFSAVTNMGGNVSSWLTQALQATGTPMSWMSGMLTMINAESTGNPLAHNSSGATGIAQMMPGTFSTNMAAGHSNILNPVDNLMASIDYIKKEYGSPSGIKNLGTSAYKGYELGTTYATKGPHWINEQSNPQIMDFKGGETVIPAGKKADYNNGTVNNFYFTGNVGDEKFFEQAAQFIAEKLNKTAINMP